MSSVSLSSLDSNPEYTGVHKPAHKKLITQWKQATCSSRPLTSGNVGMARKHAVCGWTSRATAICK